MFDDILIPIMNHSITIVINEETIDRVFEKKLFLLTRHLFENAYNYNKWFPQSQG